jgi:hypothetical protein
MSYYGFDDIFSYLKKSLSFLSYILNFFDKINSSINYSSIPICATLIITCFPWKLIPRNPPLLNSISKPHIRLHDLKKFLAKVKRWKATKSQCSKLFNISNLYLWLLKCADDGNGEWKNSPMFAYSNDFLTYRGTINRWLLCIQIVLTFFNSFLTSIIF